MQKLSGQSLKTRLKLWKTQMVHRHKLINSIWKKEELQEAITAPIYKGQ